jgi:hypothetical protein
LVIVHSPFISSHHTESLYNVKNSQNWLGYSFRHTPLSNQWTELVGVFIQTHTSFKPVAGTGWGIHSDTHLFHTEDSSLTALIHSVQIISLIIPNSILQIINYFPNIDVLISTFQSLNIQMSIILTCHFNTHIHIYLALFPNTPSNHLGYSLCIFNHSLVITFFCGSSKVSIVSLVSLVPQYR